MRVWLKLIIMFLNFESFKLVVVYLILYTYTTLLLLKYRITAP